MPAHADRQAFLAFDDGGQDEQTESALLESIRAFARWAGEAGEEKLAECLNRFPHEGIYLVPTVREFLQHHGPAAEAPNQKTDGA